MGGLLDGMRGDGAWLGPESNVPPMSAETLVAQVGSRLGRD